MLFLRRVFNGKSSSASPRKVPASRNGQLHPAPKWARHAETICSAIPHKAKAMEVCKPSRAHRCRQGRATSRRFNCDKEKRSGGTRHLDNETWRERRPHQGYRGHFTDSPLRSCKAMDAVEERRKGREELDLAVKTVMFVKEGETSSGSLPCRHLTALCETTIIKPRPPAPTRAGAGALPCLDLSFFFFFFFCQSHAPEMSI